MHSTEFLEQLAPLSVGGATGYVPAGMLVHDGVAARRRPSHCPPPDE
jgi:hypothetical protein